MTQHDNDIILRRFRPKRSQELREGNPQKSIRPIGEKLNVLKLVRLCGYRAHGGEHSAYFECHGKKVRVANHTRRARHWSSQNYDHPDINIVIAGASGKTIAKDALQPDFILVRKYSEPIERTARRLKIALSDILDAGENIADTE